MKILQEFKDLIPALTAEEYKQLEENCLAEGIRDKIILWDDYIIDGHNRFKIATEHGLSYQTKTKEFQNKNDVREWMINNQFGRRNLSNYQRSVLALELESVFSARAKENLKASGENFGKGPQISANPIEIKPIETRKELANIAKVSHDTIARVKVLEAKAPEEIKAKLRTGEVSINQAYQEIKKEEKRDRIADKNIRANNDTKEILKFKEFNVKPGDVWRLGDHVLICDDFYNADNVIADAVITDPPYGIDYDPDWKKWDKSESNFKKITGDNLEFNPTLFLNYNTVLLFGANYFTKNLPIGSWLCWDKRTKEELDDMLGSPFELAWFKSIHTKKNNIMIRLLHGGVVNADSQIGNNEKRHHPTQKPIVLFEEIINKLTKQDEIILDPFLGSGTTLIAAERTNRLCVGYEIDPLYCEIILSRYKQLFKKEIWQVLKG